MFDIVESTMLGVHKRTGTSEKYKRSLHVKHTCICLGRFERNIVQSIVVAFSLKSDGTAAQLLAGRENISQEPKQVRLLHVAFNDISFLEVFVIHQANTTLVSFFDRIGFGLKVS